jgi:type VI secretion system secreted protein VgrG
MAMQRTVRVRTVLGEALLFRAMVGREAISEPYQYQLTLVSDDDSVAFEDLLGTDMTVEVDVLGDEKRYFHGLVSHFSYVGTEGASSRYEAVLRPWLWFLTRSADCRIFQERTAVEIIKEIFAKYPNAEFEDRLGETYAKRTYCVQYRESDFNFVSRLMESEGICYFFVHEKGKHTLVLADGPNGHETFAGYADVPYFPPDDLARRERDHVFDWKATAGVRSGVYTHRSFDFEKPKADLEAKRLQPMAHALAELEVYDYPGPYTEVSQGEKLAKLRLEELLAKHQCFFGQGIAAGLAAGNRFTLARYPRQDQNREYLLLEVEHEVWDPAYRTASEAGEQEVYRCTFQAMAADQAFRPRCVTPRPVLNGPQTAMVTGPAGEEIWTDKYGRVKVQFHWDRQGKRDENTSCWVRVSQAWAGPGFGGIHIPRIGQEVVVEFEEGDVDQPLITGRVYNALAMPPYGLPASATQSGIKSNSSKGGGGSNELRFEDKKGQEQVFLHAQKNEDLVVENDKTETVKHDETLAVGNNRTRDVTVNEVVTIGGDQTVSVTGNRTDTVSQNEMRTVLIAQQQTVGAVRNVTVGASQSHEIGISDAWAVGVNRSASIGVNDSLNVGSNRDADIGSNDDLSVAKNRSASVGENDQLSVGKVLTINAGDEVTIVTGKASINMKKDGTITISGKDITVDASGKINVKASSTITMKGDKILQN